MGSASTQVGVGHMRAACSLSSLTRLCVLPADALELYHEALELVRQKPAADSSSEVAVLSSDIAAVLLKLDKPEDALHYATAATQLQPTWPKALYRQASALQALQQHTAAAQALETALVHTEPGSAQVRAPAMMSLLSNGDIINQWGWAVATLSMVSPAAAVTFPRQPGVGSTFA